MDVYNKSFCELFRRGDVSTLAVLPSAESSRTGGCSQLDRRDTPIVVERITLWLRGFLTLTSWMLVLWPRGCPYLVPGVPLRYLGGSQFERGEVLFYFGWEADPSLIRIVLRPEECPAPHVREGGCPHLQQEVSL